MWEKQNNKQTNKNFKCIKPLKFETVCCYSMLLVIPNTLTLVVSVQNKCCDCDLLNNIVLWSCWRCLVYVCWGGGGGYKKLVFTCKHLKYTFWNVTFENYNLGVLFWHDFFLFFNNFFSICVRIPGFLPSLRSSAFDWMTYKYKNKNALGKQWLSHWTVCHRSSQCFVSTLNKGS